MITSVMKKNQKNMLTPCSALLYAVVWLTAWEALMTMIARSAIVSLLLAITLPVGGCMTPEDGEETRMQTSRVAIECTAISSDGGTAKDGGTTFTSYAPSASDGGSPSDGGIGFCGCHNPLTGEAVPCTPMDYPTCPQDKQAVVVSNPVTVSYSGTAPPVAYYACGQQTCEGSTAPPVYVVTTEDFVAEFVTATRLNVFAVPAGASAVQSPNGRFLFPLLRAGDAFAHSSRPVTFTYQGVTYLRYLDVQNDCMPVAGRCLCLRC